MPLDQLYLSWHNVPCPKGRIQVFMAATPRKTADSLIKTLHEAGLEPYRMAIKPLALTKALPVNTAILIDLQPTEFDILVMTGGIAQPIRTITLPSEAQTAEQKLEMIASDLDRTIQFFDTNNPEKALNAAVPIYVSGELINQAELQGNLAQRSGHPVLPLPVILKGAEQIELGRYMVNIALAIDSSPQVREATFPVANLNVLPAPYQPKPMSLAKVVGIPAGVALAGLVIPVVMSMQSSAASIANMESQMAITNQMINQKTSQRNDLQKSVTDLGKQAAAVKKNSENLNQALARVITQQEHVNGDLAVTLDKLYPTIFLNNITEDGTTLILEGRAPNEQDIYAYAQVILSTAGSSDLSQRFQETVVTQISNKEQIPDLHITDNQDPPPTPIGGTINFTLTFLRGK